MVHYTNNERRFGNRRYFFTSPCHGKCETKDIVATMMLRVDGGNGNAVRSFIEPGGKAVCSNYIICHCSLMYIFTYFYVNRNH